MKAQKIGIGIVVLATLLPFQNCGNQWLIRDGSLDLFSKACETEIATLFQNDFYPFLRQNCAGCHTEGGAGIGHFAHPSFDKAWYDFKSMGANAIARNATNDNHKPPYTGSQHLAYIDPLKQKWDIATQKKIECESQLSGGGPLSRPFVTSEKTLPNLSNTAWTPITWNLYTESAQDFQNNLVAAEFRVEIKNLTKGQGQQQEVVGYELRNPQIKLSSLQAIKVERLMFAFNGQKAMDLTMYTQIDRVISDSSDWVDLIQNAANSFYITEVLPGTTLSVEIGRVTLNPDQPGDPGSGNNNGGPNPEPGQPPLQRVTLAELLSNDPTRNVFQTSCVGCHRAGDARGGLNITDPNQARQFANTILSRMRNTARPMPPTGLLPQDRVRLVEGWISNGTP